MTVTRAQVIHQRRPANVAVTRRSRPAGLPPDEEQPDPVGGPTDSIRDERSSLDADLIWSQDANEREQ
jgi:hypothetical protein